MGFWKRLTGAEERSMDTMDPLLCAILQQDVITRAEAMAIPAFAGCVKYISESVAALPVKLYREREGRVEEVREDPRVALLNEDTGDLLTGYQLKQALAADLIIEGGGYAYIRKERNQWLGLHYVERPAISFLPGTDPIFKRCGIMVGGREYRDFDFIKATRSTKDGVRGIGILAESQLALAVPYNTLKYENVLVKTGGNKKGFLKAEKTLTEEAVTALKEGWRKLYANNSENVVVLNKGVEFQEASSTSVELQMNENKQTNAQAVCNLFTVPPAILAGTASDEERENGFQMAVAPVLAAMEAALNRDFLLESEKGALFWAFDTKEVLKGSPEKRFRAYRDGIESNVLQIDEARYMENLPPLGLSFVKLGLQDVLYDPESKTFYAPNTNRVGKLDGPGGERLPEAAGEEPKPMSGPAAGEEIAKVSLNGAQISSILEVTQAVAGGGMERESALALLTEAFPFDHITAERILGNPKAVQTGGGEADEDRDQK